MSLVVVGTGTEVGKTVASALILQRYGAAGNLAYWKPVASGASEGRDTETVARLVSNPVAVLQETYLFSQPLSPHLAARLEGRSIDPRQILERFDLLTRENPERSLLVEGVGGLMVPLTDEGDLLVDLLMQMALPCLVVALSGLGTINHTLLTLSALRARGLEIAGVLLNGPTNPENHLAIATFGDVEVVGELEHLDPLDATSLARAAKSFDPMGLLASYLRPGMDGEWR
jgi:malonyl-CoA O-methyltransferase